MKWYLHKWTNRRMTTPKQPDEKKAYDVTVVPKVDLADIPKVISEVAGTAAAATPAVTAIPAAAAPSVDAQLQQKLVTATEKVADKLEVSQDRAKADQDKVAERLEEAEKRALEREKRAEDREERKEAREFRAKIFLATLTFFSTLAGIWAATESRNTGHAVNSRLDDTIKRVEKAAFAEGELKGSAKGK